MLTRARLLCAGLLVAALAMGGLVAAPLTLGVVGAPADHHHTGTDHDPD